MPRYHFNVYDGKTVIDRDGTPLSGPDDARRESIRLASELLRSQAMKTEIGEEWRVEVTDGRGMILFRIDILMRESAALG